MKFTIRRSHPDAQGSRGRPVVAWVAGALFPLLASTLAAQASPAGVAGEVFAGGELEDYLRVLQVAGKSPLRPWSVRGFSVDEVGRLAPRDSLHPWDGRYVFQPGGEAVELEVHAPGTQVIYNSAFPYGGSDGPVWAGRGLTTAIRGGMTARYRGLSLTVAPVAFVAQNATFELIPHPQSDEFVYADPRRPTQIDLPQRFGDGAYARIDPGQSTLRADVGGVALGISTANQYWGPAVEYPLLMGNNAPGFLHGFAGTTRPVDLWIGHGHGRFLWGRLEQSPFASTDPDSTARFGTGVVAVFTPRGVPGLEIGASRFFHVPWPEDGIGLEHFAKPFETLLKSNLITLVDGDTAEARGSVAANQLASVFARWTFPRSGLEVYGELASEDHRHNTRDWILEPEHNSAYMLGFRKVFAAGPERLWAIRGETVNGEASHLFRGRRQEPFYVHSFARQGHTHRGQILGAPEAYGGSSSTVAADYYHPGGRWTLAWKRVLRQEQGEYLQTGEVEQPDVMHGLRAEALLFRGRWDVTAGVEGVYNFNRNFESDVANLNVDLGVQLRL